MVMRKIAAVTMLFGVAMIPMCLKAQESAQTTAPAAQAPSDEAASRHFYRLNIVVKELDEASRVINSRGYVITVATATARDDRPQIIKTGSRVPILTGTSGGNTEIQYMDLGINFDVRNVRERGDSLNFGLRAELSSIANNISEASSPLRGEPVIRQNSWDSSVTIPIGKPTVVGSSDDLDSKGKMEVEVTATRVD